MVVLDVILISVFWDRRRSVIDAGRNFPQAAINPEHGGFDLATAEKYRGNTPPH
jgi:hypothetical protein